MTGVPIVQGACAEASTQKDERKKSRKGEKKERERGVKEDKSVRQDCFAARSLQFVSFVFDDLDGKKTAKRREEERKRVSLTLLVNTL